MKKLVERYKKLPKKEKTIIFIIIIFELLFIPFFLLSGNPTIRFQGNSPIIILANFLVFLFYQLLFLGAIFAFYSTHD